MTTTIEYDLKEYLAKEFGEIKSALKEIREDIAEIKLDMATVKTEITFIKSDVSSLKSSQNAQIWVLIVTVLGAVVKFGFFPNT